jgi:hypothetical protein
VDKLMGREISFSVKTSSIEWIGIGGLPEDLLSNIHHHVHVPRSNLKI